MFFFAKMWVFTQGKLSGTFEWKQKVSKNSWVWLDGPKQLSDWECGFYVMKPCNLLLIVGDTNLVFKG
jgi:hypothetical protein